MESYEKVDNLILLVNNLTHIQNEIIFTKCSYFRIARESHQVLYKSMVETLKGSANLSITGRPKDKMRSVKYQFGNKPWNEIHRIKVKGCKFAWRYSKPQECKKPKVNSDSINLSKNENYLISFYDLLAKIQTECYMCRLVMSKSISVSNQEMMLLEWLHEKVRNEYEHFIPKSYYVSIKDLIQSSILSLTLSQHLLFDSGNIMEVEIPKNTNAIISDVCNKLKAIEESYTE